MFALNKKNWKKMNGMWKRRERNDSHVAEWLIYSVGARDTGSNPARRIFFSFCREEIRCCLENFFLLIFGRTPTRSQRRRRLSTMLNPNLQLVFSGNSSFKTAPRWYVIVDGKHFHSKNMECLNLMGGRNVRIASKWNKTLQV